MAHNHLRFIASAALVAGCAGVDYTAPTGSSLQISANPAEIALNGGTSLITISAFQASGIPVADGAHISLTTTLGVVTPDVTTTGGIAKATLTSNGVGGTATVTAFSGAAESDTVDVKIGVAADSIALGANPASLPAGGGTVQLSATVFGASGSPVPGASVVFTTTQGTLQSNSVAVTTDASGRAVDTLRTTATAEVTSTAGSKTKSVTVNVGTTDVENVILSADRVSLPTGGGTSNLVAVVLGSSGPLPGVAVAWSATVGTLGQTGVTYTNAAGEATNSLTTTGTSTVSAAAAGKDPVTLQIQVGTGTQSARVAVSTDRGSIPAMTTPDGDCSTPGAILPVTVTAQVTDDTGSPIKDREVIFYIDFAGIANCARAYGEFCGTGGDVVTAVTNASGVAVVYFGMKQEDLDFCNCLPSGTKCSPPTGLCSGTCGPTCSSTEDLYCQIAISAVSGGVESSNSPVIEYGR